MSGPTSVNGSHLVASQPPSPPPATTLYVRVEADPARAHARITTRDGALSMFVPTERVRARFAPRERIVFFRAILSEGILDLEERTPEKGWEDEGPVPVAKRLTAGPAPTLPLRTECPCGAPYNHKELCRDAIAIMHGRRRGTYRTG